MFSSRLPGYCFAATGALLTAGMPAAHAGQPIHTVKPGETLSSISRKYHVPVQDIVQANHLTHSDALSDGTVLKIPSAPKPTLQAATMHKSASIFGDRISVRMGPSVDARRVDLFDMGSHLTVTATKAGWFQVTLADGRKGWVRQDFVKLDGAKPPVQLAGKTGKHTTIKLVHAASHQSLRSASHRKHVAKEHFASASHSTRRTRRTKDAGLRVASSNDVVRTAIAYRGTPYHYGGTGRSGFDCSGFTSYIYRQKGVALPHSAAAQFGHGVHVSKSELKPGDLVFFHCGRRGISHVGIFVGNGKFVHASSPRSGGVRVDSLNSSYYKSTFRGARRVKK